MNRKKLLFYSSLRIMNFKFQWLGCLEMAKQRWQTAIKNTDVSNFATAWLTKYLINYCDKIADLQSNELCWLVNLFAPAAVVVIVVGLFVFFLCAYPWLLFVISVEYNCIVSGMIQLLTQWIDFLLRLIFAEMESTVCALC